MVIFVLLFSNISYALNYDEDLALTWLENNINWNSNNIEELVFSSLALGGGDSAKTGIYDIVSQDTCGTNGNNCDTKDIALVALALDDMNEDISDMKDWLENSLSSSSSTGWNLQIITDETGQCEVTNDEDTQNIQVSPNVGWIRLNFDFDDVSEIVEVDCNELGDSSMMISLLRISGNTFYLIDQENGDRVSLNLDNGCYPRRNGESCDKESSFYVAWALDKLGEDVDDVVPYLEDHADSNLYKGMLISIARDSALSEVLSFDQNEAGSWDNSVYTTSFIVDGTTIGNDALAGENWIKEQQDEDGSLGNILDTAVGLSVGLGTISTGGGGGGGNLGPECTDDSFCQADEYCNTLYNICVPREQTGCDSNDECTVGSPYCDTSGFCVECLEDSNCFNQVCENNLCVTPSFCGDGDCDLDEDTISCPEDCETQVNEEICYNNIDDDNDGYVDCEDTECFSDSLCQEEESKSLSWLWIAILFLILVVIGWFAYRKLKPKNKKGKGKSNYLLPSKPGGPSPVRQVSEKMPSRMPKPNPNYARDEALERELDKSIKEAEKLLKKKK